jgi:hypothetical protein
MAFKFFTIPLRDVLSAESELNAFLGSHRVLGVDRQMVDRGANSFWTLCVEYLPGVVSAAAPSFDKKGRIDYREVLPPECCGGVSVASTGRPASAETGRMGGDATGVGKICSAMRRQLTGLPERREPAAILAEKPANANRRERLLSAVSVNS